MGLLGLSNGIELLYFYWTMDLANKNNNVVICGNYE